MGVTRQYQQVDDPSQDAEEEQQNDAWQGNAEH